jgi:hypothetical protein
MLEIRYKNNPGATTAGAPAGLQQRGKHLKIQ